MPWALPRRYLQIPSAAPLLGLSRRRHCPYGQRQDVTVPSLALMFSLPSPTHSVTS